MLKSRGAWERRRSGFSTVMPIRPFPWKNRARWQRPSKTRTATCAIPSIPACPTTRGTRLMLNRSCFTGCCSRNYISRSKPLGTISKAPASQKSSHQSSATRSVVRKAGLFYFVWVMFSYCTGGPFGLEDMVTTSGPGMTLIYLLVIPFFWSIPVSLVSAELTTAMPVEGGFYRWVRAGFGDFWGFLAGWWNWCASFLLGAVYAVQFADYMGFYVPGLTDWKHYAVSLLLVAIITYINVRGIDAVGKFATALELFILLPVAVLVVMGLMKWQHNPFVPVIPPHQPMFNIFGVGLAIGLWLYSGYEQCSSVAEEVDNPTRSY